MATASDADEPNVDAELLFCEIELKILAGDAFWAYTKSTVKRRIAVLERCSRALLKAKNVGARLYIQSAACTVWNAALPLLQPRQQCGRGLAVRLAHSASGGRHSKDRGSPERTERHKDPRIHP